MESKIDDYLAFGVRHVWVIDPRKKGWLHREGSANRQVLTTSDRA